MYQRQYRALIENILNAQSKDDRTGTGTLSDFGNQLKIDLKQGFPLLTLKHTSIKNVIHELLWFIRGDTNIRLLNKNGVHIWDKWADEKGNLGNIYGAQWRDFQDFDQLSELMDNLLTRPYSRRHIVTAWNPLYLPYENLSPQENVKIGNMALAPCHVLFQCNVRGNVLDMQVYQRSADCFIGLPYNIASYALLTHMIAQQCDFEVGNLIFAMGDCHLYKNHVEQAKLMLSRDDLSLPTIKIKKASSLFNYQFSDFELLNYQSHPFIKADIAV